MLFSLEYKINDKVFVTSTGDENVTIENTSNNDHVLVKIKPLKNITLVKCTLECNNTYHKNDKIFVNGYQSWTDSKEFSVKDSLKDATKLPKKLEETYAFSMYGDAYFKKYNKHVLHGFDVSYIKGENPIFIGSSNYKNSYLIINHLVKKNKIVFESDVDGLVLNNEEFTVFDFVIESDIEKGIEKYFNTKKEILPLFGYTSWYNHYQDISEEKILYSLNKIDSRFNLFQIDDGYEAYIGDWLNVDKKKFPNGLKDIVNQIHDKEMKAGIWLAPFAGEKDSDLVKNHSDWFLKDENGNMIKTGSNWSSFFALDFYNLEAREYIKKCLEYYIDLGFDFFKLDFLYALCVRTPKNKTRAQVNNEAYSFLREVLKGKLILGCGAVISPSQDAFDYLRVGPDVSLKFDDVWYMKFMHRERISTKVTVQNTIYRSFYDGRAFGNDPDVFLLRDDNLELSFEQRKALTIINALFGSVLMTSDDIGDYDDAKKEVLNHVLDVKKHQPKVYFEKRGEKIYISYVMNEKKYEHTYDVKKGILL